jgi:uncharacterized protein (TIGR02271 family)
VTDALPNDPAIHDFDFLDAFSPDGGRQWETNWITDFERRTGHPRCSNSSCRWRWKRQMADNKRPERTMPVVEEVLQVDRRKVETGAVRVRLHTTETAHPVQLDSWSERVHVERVAIGEPVAERREPWHDGDTLVVPVYEERLVLQRTLVLKEELRLRRMREHDTEETVAMLRRDEVHAERRNDDGTWSPIDDDAPRSGAADIPHTRKEPK